MVSSAYVETRGAVLEDTQTAGWKFKTLHEVYFPPSKQHPGNRVEFDNFSHLALRNLPDALLHTLVLSEAICIRTEIVDETRFLWRRVNKFSNASDSHRQLDQ